MQYAGQAFTSGGFGCVFKPALKCKGEKKRTDGVSKLMSVKNANEEFQELNKFTPIISTIPNYENYFLLKDINICQPAELTKSDLNKFNSVCSNFYKKGYSEEGLNYQTSLFRIINMPYGGKSIDMLINSKKTFDSQDINILNNSLIKLLYKGIIPMNERNLYHLDVKDSNILFSEKDNFCRLIDWGLSGLSTKKEVVPEIMKDRVIQYNVPFSNILFSDDFYKSYTKFLKQSINIPKEHVKDKTKLMVVNYIFTFFNNDSRGHWGYLKYMNNMLYGKKLLINDAGEKKNVLDYEFTFDIIVDYLCDVLYKYTDYNSNKFLHDKYFKEVFSKNVDVWGFITTYFAIYLKFYNSTQDKYLLLKSRIRDIITNYCFSTNYASIPINLEKLLRDLKNLSIIIGEKPESMVKKIVVSSDSSSISSYKTVESKISSSSKKTKGTKGTKKNNTKKIIIKSSMSPFTWRKKRCPNKTRRNIVTKKCEYIG